MSTAAAQEPLLPKPGRAALPGFDAGWVEGGAKLPFLSYVGDEAEVNWSDELEDLHEESSRTHFIDVWTRCAMLERLGPVAGGGAIADLGCSTGYLLEDLRAAYPVATLYGLDLVAPGLAKAHGLVPDARLLRADVCALPFADASLDAVVSANLLEHVPDDVLALKEMARTLRPGALAVIVIPAGPGTYDYYDRFLGHERRYGRGELAGKARGVGFDVVEDVHLGSIFYPAFWAVKKRNRSRYDNLESEALEQKVARDIDQTQNSKVGEVACRLERSLLRRHVRIPFGVRGLTVLRKP